MLPGKQQVSLNWLSLLLLVPPPAPLTLQDFNGRLWGQNEDETSCAYKTADNSPIYYADYKRITWQESPVCRGYNQTTDSAQPDAEGRLWGYQNGANCVFIHPDGTPVKDVNELLPKDQVEVSKGTCSHEQVAQHAINLVACPTSAAHAAAVCLQPAQELHR
jgi:hypothetical protein